MKLKLIVDEIRAKFRTSSANLWYAGVQKYKSFKEQARNRYYIEESWICPEMWDLIDNIGHQHWIVESGQDVNRLIAIRDGYRQQYIESQALNERRDRMIRNLRENNSNIR